MGKTMCQKIRDQAQGKGLTGYQGFGKSLPAEMKTDVAEDLLVLLKKQLS